jgi:hypothetical protein
MDRLNQVINHVKEMWVGCSDNVYNELRNRLIPLELDKPIVKIVEVRKEVYVLKKHQRVNIKWWAMDWLNDNNLTYEQLADKTKKSEVVKIRRWFCIQAFQQGYTVTAIAKYLGVKFGTVRNAIKNII